MKNLQPNAAVFIKNGKEVLMAEDDSFLPNEEKSRPFHGEKVFVIRLA